MNSKTLAFPANIAICNFFPALYEFEDQLSTHYLVHSGFRQKQGVELFISHWYCVRICKFFVFPWTFLASRNSFNSKFPIPNEVAICEIPRKLIKCFFASVIFLCSLPIGILLRCLSKAFSSPHPKLPPMRAWRPFCIQKSAKKPLTTKCLKNLCAWVQSMHADQFGQFRAGSSPFCF